MSRNYLSEFSREEIKIGEEDEEIVSLNKRTPTEETISYQRTLLKRANEEKVLSKTENNANPFLSGFLFSLAYIWHLLFLLSACVVYLSCNYLTRYFSHY